MYSLPFEMTEKIRCFGNNNPVYAKYHDEEWGIPVHDDRHLFEMLILEGAQAGLSWETVLMKRDEYRKVFHNFDIKKVAQMSDAELEKALLNPGIIRNRLKVYSARRNARCVLEIIEEHGSLNEYLWSFVHNVSVINRPKDFSEVPVSTPESDALAKALKKKGLNFVGSTILYAFMQAVGMVDDHIESCWKCVQ